MGSVLPQEGPAPWLLVSYWANADGIMPSFHVDDRLPHLCAAGIEVEVITGICGQQPAGWEGRWHRLPTPSASGMRYELRHFLRGWPRPWGGLVKALLTLLLFPLYLVEKCLANLESTFWWWIPAALAGRWYTRRQRPAVIYSTGGPLASHFAAALIARARGVPWIAEIRDPLPYQRDARGRLHRRVVGYLERLIHTRAAGVVYVTRTASERAQLRTEGTAACTAIYAGGDAAPGGAPPAEPGRMRLMHAGSLAGTRHPGVLLQALERVVAQRPEAQEAVRLTLLGSMDRACRRMVEQFPHPEMVEVIDKLPRAEAREIIGSANVLLVIQNLEPVSEETIPSKTYDYLAAGKPILGLLYHNAELAGLLEEAGHEAVEADDPEEVARAIAYLYGAWQQGRLTARPETRYSRAAAAAGFVAWVRGLPAVKEAEERWAGEKTSVASTRRS